MLSQLCSKFLTQYADNVCCGMHVSEQRYVGNVGNYGSINKIFSQRMLLTSFSVVFAAQAVV